MIFAIGFAIYVMGLLPAAVVIFDSWATRVDGYTATARLVLWPLFALKLFLRVLIAGWKDLLA